MAQQPRPAATLVLLRPGANGPEVLMIQRTQSAAFLGGAYVFPGGAIDAADSDPRVLKRIVGLAPEAADARLKVPNGLAYYVAAIRESFEEAGVLLARPEDGEAPVEFADPRVAQRFNAARHRVHDGEGSLVELCAAERLVLLPARLEFVAHWLTPVGESRRFDTRFFMAEAPPSQDPLHDDSETIASLWVRPSDALARWEARELQMFPPTVASLRALDEHATVAEAMSAARAVGVPPRLEPRLLISPEGKFKGIALPGEPGYDEAEAPEFVIGGR